MFMSRRRLPAACSQRVCKSDGFMSLGLPAILSRWFKHWSSWDGVRASVRNRARMRLAMGKSWASSKR